MRKRRESARKPVAGKMASVERDRKPWPRWTWVVPPALCFLAYALTIALWAEPRVQFFGRQAAFYFDERFFRSFLIWPGGIVEFLSRGLQQCYQFTWLGVAITTALAGLLTLGSWRLLRKLGPAAAGALCLWPSLGLLAIQRQYDFPWLETGLGLTGAVWLAVAYLAIPSRNPWLRWLLFLAISLPAYAALAGASLLFALCCGLVEMLAWRRYWLALALGCVAASIPVVGAWYFALHLSDAYLLLLPFGLGHFPLVLALLPWAALPLAILVKAGRSFLRPGPDNPQLKSGAQSPSNWRRLVEPALSLLLAVGAVVFGWNALPQRLARIQCLSHDRNWDRVLTEARLFSVYNPSTITQVNRALRESGRLADEMFAFPQKPDYAFWLSSNYSEDGRQSMLPCEVLFQVGQINRAERIAGEALERDGYLPDVLRYLADVNVLKREPQTARVFLNILAKTPFQRDWARQRLNALEADSRLPDDPELQRVRALQVTGDYPLEATTEKMLIQCLSQNQSNRAAFEYLMSYYLLTLNLDGFVQYLRGARNCGYAELPAHYDEALALVQTLKNAPPDMVDSKGYSPRETTVQRLERFLGQLKLRGNNLQLAQTELAPEFGNTYWYYYVFKTTSAALTRTDLFAKKP